MHKYLPILFISLIYLLADLYIYWFYLRGKIQKRYIIGYGCISGGLLVIYLPLFLLSRQTVSILPYEGVMWSIFILFSQLLPKLVFIAISLIGKLPLLWKKPPWKLVTQIGLVAAIVAFFAMCYGAAIGRNNLVVKRLTIEQKHLPTTFDNFTLAHISDLHVGNFGTTSPLLEAMVDSINRLNPDVVFFTGDLVNINGKELSNYYVNLLSKIQPPVVAVLGNHDYGDYSEWSNIEERDADKQLLKDRIAQMDWLLLTDSNTTIHHTSGDSIVVIGSHNWGYPPFSQYSNLLKALNGTEKVPYKILLTHNPNHWKAEVVNKHDISLTLSGHTHAAQVALGNISPSRLRDKMWRGIYTQNEQTLHVNTGMGYVLFPVRIGVNPEITLITLKRKP